MPTGSDQTRRRERREPESDRVSPERRRNQPEALDRDRAITREAAARLQQGMGNQAIRALVDRPGAAGFASDDVQAREAETEVESEAPDREPAVERHPLAALPARGLPAAGGPSIEGDLQYGGDDDDDPPMPLPEGRHPLAIPRAARGNRARLDALRAAGRLPAEALEESEAARVAFGPPPRRDPPSPRGDARIRAPMAAWGDPALLAGRSLAPEDLADLAGPSDPLARPSLAAAFLREHASDALARGLAGVAALPPGPLVAGFGSAAGATATLAALVALAAVLAEPEELPVVDRALATTLDEVSLERVAAAAGEDARGVPPGHVLFARVVAAGPPTSTAPGPLRPAARRWLLPAVEHAAGVLPLPLPPSWDLPAPADPVEEDPSVAAIDRILGGSAAAPGAEALAPLLEAVDDLLRAGGRIQVEIAAAAVAARVAGEPAEAALRTAYLRCRDAARGLIAARDAIEAGPGLRAGPALAARLAAARDALSAARHEALAALAALADPGGSAVDPSVHEASVLGEAARAALARGVLALARGQPAESLLRGALDAALDAGDDLVASAAALLALPLAQGREAREDAADLADLLGRLAVRRGSPAALLAAADGRATAALALGDPAAALLSLFACGRLLRALGEEDALALVRARVAEVRARLGERAFATVARQVAVRVADEAGP